MTYNPSLPSLAQIMISGRDADCHSSLSVFWEPLLCCLKLSQEIYFRLKQNPGVLFQRALEGPHAVLFLIAVRAGGCRIHLNGNCLVYPPLSSLVLDLCSKSSIGPDSAHSPHLAATDRSAVTKWKKSLTCFVNDICAFDLVVLIGVF